MLWKKYTQLNQRTCTKITCREKTLFHGTRQTDPKEIYKGDSSFDMRHCRDGSWGKGNYFAVNASLADGYAYGVHGVKKLLLARVLTGLSYFSQPKKFLKPPPLQSADGTRGVQRRYNSVTGQLGGSTIYIFRINLSVLAYFSNFIYAGFYTIYFYGLLYFSFLYPSS